MNTNMPADESDISSEESKWSLRTIDETGSTISSLDKGDSGTLRDLDDQIGGQVYNEDDEITTINLDNYFMIDNPTTAYIYVVFKLQGMISKLNLKILTRQFYINYYQNC